MVGQAFYNIFDLIFVYLFFVSCVFERRNTIFWLFWYCFCSCMLFSKKQAFWRKEKEMKNKVMNILKYFVVSVFFGVCRYENAFAFEF